MGVWQFWVAGEGEFLARERWWRSELAGGGSAIARVRRQAAGLAALQSPVLVTGEVGCGRTRVARALHAQGRAPNAAFLVLDPLRWPSPLSMPAAGTVCVRHVEDLTREQQSWCVRLLLSAAPVARLVACGSPAALLRFELRGFDAELVRQLQRFELTLPALRERREDIPELASQLLAGAARELSGPERPFGPAALRRLHEHPWFGNVAELKRVAERLVAYSASGPIQREEVAEVLGDLRPSVRVMREQHRYSEREDLIRALTEAGGNITRTAERLGRSRAAVYRLVEKHGVSLRS